MGVHLGRLYARLRMRAWLSAGSHGVRRPGNRVILRHLLPGAWGVWHASPRQLQGKRQRDARPCSRMCAICVHIGADRTCAHRCRHARAWHCARDNAESAELAANGASLAGAVGAVARGSRGWPARAYRHCDVIAAVGAGLVPGQLGPVPLAAARGGSGWLLSLGVATGAATAPRR